MARSSAKSEKPPFTPKGAALELFRLPEKSVGKIIEVLIEGPRGTGKTRAVCELINFLCETYPGLRVLMLRKTLKSIRESVLVTFEDRVLWPGHPAIVGTATRAHREFYHYPNGAHIAVAGIDTPSRYLSTEWDVVYCAEAIEMLEEDVDYIKGSVGRSRFEWRMPFQLVIEDCNPGRERHWLNQRFSPANLALMPERVRLFSKLEDNESLHPDFIRNLSQLTGARRDRFYLGKWVSEEGLVYPEFVFAQHVIENDRALPEMAYYVAGQDWGFNNPGVLAVWGVSWDNRLYLVKELYQTEKDIDWWADKAEWLASDYNLRAIICDPSRPEMIQLYNDRLGKKMGRHAYGLAVGGDNEMDSGISQVRSYLIGDGGGPKIHFLRDARISKDQELEAKNRPTCTWEEFDDFTWAEFDESKTATVKRDQPDKRCDDHGLDQTRYVVKWHWLHGLTGVQKKPQIKPGTWADVLGHAKVHEPKKPKDDDNHWII